LLALSLAAVVLGLFIAIVIMPLWQSVTLHEQRVDVLRAQANKLEALAAATPDLEKLARKVAANAQVNALTFAGAQPGVGVADLQSTLNRILGTAGATVMSGQAVEGDPSPDKIAVQTTIETDLASLVRALHEIGTARPLLKVEKLSIKEPDGEWVNPSAARNVANKLIVDMTVSARMRGL
jgi:hypothetical protein